MTPFQKLCKDLESQIESSYTEGVTLEVAERLAGKFLNAQFAVSAELTKADLHSRMCKAGVKSIRAAIYMSEATKGDKKPTEAMLTATLDKDEIIATEQEALDKAEVLRDELRRYYDIFQNAHIHFRTIAKGSMGGG